VFVDDGVPMSALLGAIGGSGERSAYLSLVRAAARPATHESPRAAPLVDPLTERELDVLRLLRSDLDGPDIARELHVSLNTVRTHTKNVYAKLGVSNRRAAVRRADELGVFSHR
jgi:LuxR family maltose regulon positive regulatory protein